ncbi:MAG: VTT domain-containing protein [Sporolactobacillus sp.]|jgi:uncharacterized membrane protein YdjX (TVP38/TMEM64 family)|nr:VTT domain-containing protein [Sporolactobacillus sp.]MCI1881868.1 VTT domain-containing protein [Sporolactobacillus sp.]
MNFYSRIRVIIHSVALCAALILIIWPTVRYGPELTRLASNPGEMEAFLNSYGGISIFVFIGFQLLQVIIAVIPGEVPEIAGGFVYGALLGSLYSLIGIAIGSTIAFYLARLFGGSLLRLFIEEKRMEKLSLLVNSRKSQLTTLILFLIPGMPKDLLCYIAGLTPVRPLGFLMVSMAARIPSLVVACSIGANLQKENYIAAAIVTGIAAAVLVTAFLMKSKTRRLLAHLLERSDRKKKE